MTLTTNHYDLIVLGSDVAGLLAAAHTAQRGRRVLVIPIRPITARYKLGQDTFSLDCAPLVHLTSPTVRRSCEDLALWTQLRREVRPAGRFVHWILPNGRLDLATGASNLVTESIREWPGADVEAAWSGCATHAASADEVLDGVLGTDGALSSERFWVRRFLERSGSGLPGAAVDEFDPLPKTHALRVYAHAAAPWLLGLTPDQLGKAASLRLWGMWSRGPSDRSDGISGLRDLLIARIALKSGEIKPGLRVAEVLLKRGKVIGVNLLGRGERYGCDHLIVADDPRTLLGGPLVPEQIPRPLARTLAGIETPAAKYLMHVRVGPRGLGPGLDGIAICVTDDPAGRGIGNTYVRTGRVREDGSRDLSITRIINADAPLSELREQVLAELDDRGVLPFARPHIRLIHSPHDGRAATDGEGRARADLGPDSAMRLPMSALYRSQGTPTLGVGVLPTATGVRNLFLACHLNFPGLGLEGEFAAGHAAANLVAPPSRGSLGRASFLRRS
ncbi:MAG: hypothetical protein V3V08_02250 [Nannocystaceae bacterium]